MAEVRSAAFPVLGRTFLVIGRPKNKRKRERGSQLDQSLSPALMQEFTEEAAKEDAGEDTRTIHNDTSIEFANERLAREGSRTPSISDERREYQLRELAYQTQLGHLHAEVEQLQGDADTQGHQARRWQSDRNT